MFAVCLKGYLLAVSKRIHSITNVFFFISVPSTPQPCPFQGFYTFSYTNGTMSTQSCDSPVSEVRACADDSKFKFVFKQCPGIPGTYNKGRFRLHIHVFALQDTPFMPNSGPEVIKQIHAQPNMKFLMLINVKRHFNIY